MEQTSAVHLDSHLRLLSRLLSCSCSAFTVVYFIVVYFLLTFLDLFQENQIVIIIIIVFTASVLSQSGIRS